MYNRCVLKPLNIELDGVLDPLINTECIWYNILLDGYDYVHINPSLPLQCWFRGMKGRAYRIIHSSLSHSVSTIPSLIL